MRFDNGNELEKQTIDITPLIDIIFLLVMFFAVSTSFISGADLQSLRDNLSSLTTDKSNLDNELGLLKSDLDEKAQEEQLLRQLLAEQQQEAASLDDVKTNLEGQNTELQSQLAVLQGLLASKDSDLAEVRSSSRLQQEESEDQLQQALQSIEALNQKLAAQQSELLASQEDLDTREVLLQKLIAEKAAELNGLKVKLESAESSSIDLRQQLLQSQREIEESKSATAAQQLQSQSRIEILEAELTKFRGLADLDQEKLLRAVEAQEMLNERMSTYLDDNSLGISRDEQKITLQLADKILFSSGSPDIKPGGLEVLRDLGDLISGQIEGLEILVGGHTDNIPVSSSRSAVSDNWGLSAARAVNVVRFFEDELGVNPQLMAAVGYGEFRPIADNDTAAGRSRNRRIEIVLLPK